MRLQLTESSYADIEICRKKIKHLILRIYPNGKIKLSAPNSAKNGDIKRFLEQKRSWIQKNIENIVNSSFSDETDFNQIRLLGEWKKFNLIPGDRNTVTISGDHLIIQYSDNNNAFTVLDNWWRRKALEYFNAKLDFFMPLFEEYRIKRPRINVRKMKSLWGSCTPKKGTVRFNYYLLTVPDKCIDYVVLHELTHLIHPDHGASFKAFLSKHMPDWKERKKVLNTTPFIEDMRKFENVLKSD